MSELLTRVRNFVKFAGVCFLWLCFLPYTPSKASAQYGEVSAPAPKVWLSLARSSVAPGPPYQSWLRTCINSLINSAICDGGEKRIAGIIVPVFSQGICFYSTRVKPFEGRDSHGDSDGSLLRQLLNNAQKRHIPVFLSVNVLDWQAFTPGAVGKVGGIFQEHPDWCEKIKASVLPQQPDAYYASPFNDDVQSRLRELVLEIGRTFPDATGIVLDLHLSNREILGFSDAARIACINSLGIDPDELDLQNRADDANTKLVQDWSGWRRQRMAHLFSSLRDAYLSIKPDGSVMCYGTASYYQRQEFNDLRLAQDWRYWLKQGLADGAFIEGRWPTRYSDSRYFSEFYGESHPAATKSGKPVLLIPISTAKHIVHDTTYANDVSVK